MALRMEQAAVESQVLAKLREQEEEMEKIHSEMAGIVSDLIGNHLIEGQSACAYAGEFNDRISEIFRTLNQNLQSYCQDLQEVCRAMERADQNTASVLGQAVSGN